MQAEPAVLLLWLLYQNRVRRRGTSSRDAVFDPGLGVTPENSVVNGADTSTDSRVAWLALSAKKYVAPLLVKTCEAKPKMRIFFRELTMKISTRDARRASPRSCCPHHAMYRAGNAFAGFAQDRIYLKLAYPAVILIIRTVRCPSVPFNPTAATAARCMASARA